MEVCRSNPQRAMAACEMRPARALELRADGPSSGSSLCWCLEKAGSLRQTAVLTETAKAGTLDEDLTLSVVHRPLKNALIVVLKKAVVLEPGTRKLLLRLADAGDEFVEAMGLGVRVGIDDLVGNTLLRAFSA